MMIFVWQAMERYV